MAHALYNAKRGTLKPADLNGKRVGIRSFTTTTGAWLRGILANDYGVDLNSIDWVTLRGRACRRIHGHDQAGAAGQAIVQMLLDGELDAVLGEKSDQPDLRPLFADVAAEENAWFAKHNVVPINHMVVVSRACPRQHPEAVREVLRLLQQSAAPAPGRAAVQRRRNAPLARIDHPLLRAAGAHSARVCRRRTVRRCDANAVS